MMGFQLRCTVGRRTALLAFVVLYCLPQCGGAAITSDTAPTAPLAADFAPLDKDGLLAKIISPHTVKDFMEKYYERATLRIARGDSDHFAWLRAGSFDRLNNVVDAFQRDGSLASGIKVMGRQRQPMGREREKMHEVTPA